MLLKRKYDAMVGIDDPLTVSMLAHQMKHRATGTGRKVIIGMGAYNRIPPKLRAMLEAALKEHARRKKCNVSDLLWTIGFFGNNVPVIRIKKRPRIEVR